MYQDLFAPKSVTFDANSNGAKALFSRPRPARHRLDRIASIRPRSSLIGPSSSVVTHPTEPAECESEPATSAIPR